MKKLVSLILTVCICLSALAMLTSCGGMWHTHTYDAEWSKDATHHWHACDYEGCADVADKAEHTWDDGEITTEATAEADGVKTFTCTVCGATKTENVEYTPDQSAPVDTNYVFTLHPHRGNLAVSLFDDEGRLSEIWDVDDRLEWQYPFLVPSYSFKYNADGYLSYYKGSTVESEIAYDEGGTPYFVDSKINNTIFSLSSVSYHENGSVKSIAFYYGNQLQTDVYDENGRSISMAWENSNGTGGAYNSSYEGNVQTITMIQNGKLYDAEILVNYSEDGKPLKQVTRMGEEGVVNKEWIYDGNVLVSVNDHDSSLTTSLTYDNNGLLVKTETKKNDAVTEYTVFTYDGDGLRLCEKTYAADGTYKQGYTYSYEGNVRKTVALERVEDAESRSVWVYDAYANRISHTLYQEYEGEYKDGNNTTYYTENYVEYDAKGRIVLSTDTTYIDVDGVRTKWNVYTYRSDYDVPADAKYEWVRLDSRTYYFDAPDGINGLHGEDMYLTVVHYAKRVADGNTTYEGWVDEATGDPLPEGSEKWTDDYGNYYEVIDGERTNRIIYYQKYCDSNGAFWYFTSEGVKTPLA